MSRSVSFTSSGAGSSASSRLQSPPTRPTSRSGGGLGSRVGSRDGGGGYLHPQWKTYNEINFPRPKSVGHISSFDDLQFLRAKSTASPLGVGETLQSSSSLSAISPRSRLPSPASWAPRVKKQPLPPGALSASQGSLEQGSQPGSPVGGACSAACAMSRSVPKSRLLGVQRGEQMLVSQAGGSLSQAGGSLSASAIQNSTMSSSSALRQFQRYKPAFAPMFGRESNDYLRRRPIVRSRALDWLDEHRQVNSLNPNPSPPP